MVDGAILHRTVGGAQRALPGVRIWRAKTPTRSKAVNRLLSSSPFPDDSEDPHTPLPVLHEFLNTDSHPLDRFRVIATYRIHPSSTQPSTCNRAIPWPTRQPPRSASASRSSMRTLPLSRRKSNQI